MIVDDLNVSSLGVWGQTFPESKMMSHFPFSSLYCTIRESVTGIVRTNQDFPCLGASRNFLTPSLPPLGPWDSDPLHQSPESCRAMCCSALCCSQRGQLGES